MRSANPVPATPSLLSSRISSLSFAEVSLRRSFLSLLATARNTNDARSTDSSSSSFSSNNSSPFFIIGGIDSNTHPLHEAVLKYLVLGSSDIYEPTLQPQYNHVDDTVLLCTPRDITIINTLMDTTNTNNVNSNLYSLHKLRGLKVYRVSPREREGDGEVAELYKILSFVDLVTSSSSSSTSPLSLSSSPSTVLRTPLETNPSSLFDTSTVPKAVRSTSIANSIVETWPLVQAYALQDIGPGGFFTMRYRLEDTSTSLIHILAHMDTHNVKKLLWSNNPTLIRQYRAFESTLTQIRNTGRRWTVLSCESISEPLVSFYEFASMQNQNTLLSYPSTIVPNSSILSRGAGVLVGRFTETITQGITNPNNGASFSLQKCGYSFTTSTNTSSNDTIMLPPVHCIVQSDDPTTGLRVCRTIALGTGRLSVSSDESFVHCQHQLLHSVFSLYALLAEGFRTGLAQLPVPSLNFTPTQYINNVCTVIKTSIERTLMTKRSLLPSTLSFNSSLLIEGDILNAQGQSISRNSVTSSLPFQSRYLYYITVAITNLQDTQYNVPIGSIAIGDTCIITPSSALLPPSPFATSSTVDMVPSLLVPTVPDSLLHRSPLPKGNVPNVSSIPLIRVLTAHVPLSHVFTIGGKEGEQIHTLAETVTQVSSLLTPSNISASSASASTTQDPFTVGSYGGGVGKGRRVGTNSNIGNSIIDDSNVTPKPDIETLNQNVTNSMLTKLSQTRLQEIKNAYTEGTYEALVASLGSLIPNGVYHNVTLLTGGTVVHSTTGTLKLHEKGCILLSPAVGPIIISMTEHIDSGSSIDQSNDKSSNKGLYVIFGNDILTNQINLPSRNHDNLRQCMMPWIDNNFDTVNEAAKSMVDAFVSVANSTANAASTSTLSSVSGKAIDTKSLPSSSSSTSASSPVPTVSTAATETLLASPSDVLLFRTHQNSPQTNYKFAGAVSSSSTVASGTWLGLVLQTNSELRSSIFEIMNSWRDSVPENTRVSMDNGNTSSATTDNEYISKGLLPSSFILGYVRTCPYAWAWTMAWEDCYLLETLLRNDMENMQSIMAYRSSKPPSLLALSSSSTVSTGSIPVYVISGVAGSYASRFAKSMVEVMNASRPGTLTIIDCNDIRNELSSEASFTVSNVHKCLQETIHRNPKLTHLLFVAPYHTDPVDILNILNRYGNSITPAGNITVINPKQIHMDQRRTQYLPYLMESVSSGWCQALVCIGDTSTSGGTEKDEIDKYIIGPSKIANPSLQIIRISNILNQARLFTLSLPTVQSLLREVPLLFGSTKSSILRNIALPGWMYQDLSLHRSSTILHVYAPQGRNYMSGATLSAEGDPTVRRVLSFMNVPCASSYTFPFAAAVDESSMYSFLRKLVVPYVDRPASVCLEFDATNQSSQPNNASNEAYRLPGICVPLTIDRNNSTNSTVTEGEVYISSWSVSGYIRCTTGLPTTAEVTSNDTIDKPSTDLVAIRPPLIKDDYVDSDEEENERKNERQEIGANVSNIAATSSVSTVVPPSSSIVPPTYPTEAPLYAIDATPHAIKLTPVPTELRSQCIPHVQLHGVGPGIDKVQRYLYKSFIHCRPSLPTAVTERSVSSLSSREISTIVRVHAADCLPADVTYDGAGSYFDMEGKQLLGHPLALAFATRHMVMYNALCTIRNRFVSLCQVCANDEENKGIDAESNPDQLSTIVWPTEKDEVDLHTAIEEANRTIPSLPPVQLGLPPSVSSSWWIQVQRMDQWLKYVPVSVSALRF